MKPFNLEAAKRGDPIQTRSGQSVKFIAYVPEADLTEQVIILNETTVLTYTAKGEFLDGNSPSSLDLFMTTRKRTVWINIYKSAGAFFYDTEEQADAANNGLARIGNKAYPIEIEE